MSHINPKRPLSSDTIINIIADCVQQGKHAGTLPINIESMVIESMVVDNNTTNTIDTTLYIQGEYGFDISKEQRSNIIKTLKDIGVHIPKKTTYLEIKAKRGEYPVITLKFFPTYPNIVRE